jgi:hypothetical protein
VVRYTRYAMTASKPDSPEDHSGGPEENGPEENGPEENGPEENGPEEESGRSRDLLPDPKSPADWAQRYALGTRTGLKNRSHLAEVERFALFVGYPRSGHSLIGSLLNAHPDMVIAHELGVFDFLDRHFGRTALFGLLSSGTRHSPHSAGSGPTTTTPSPGSTRGSSAVSLSSVTSAAATRISG